MILLHRSMGMLMGKKPCPGSGLLFVLANCFRRYESPATQIPAEIQNFPLSKARLNKNNIVYSDEHTLCVRIREKMV